jgi:hypothetical protein
VPIFIGGLPAITLFAVSLIIALLSIALAGTIYVSFIYIVMAMVVFSIASVRPIDDPIGARKLLLSDTEERLLHKYYVFLLYPLGTQTLAHFINLARVFGVFWIAIGLWKGLYWLAIANTVFYLLSAPVMRRLSPIARNKAAAELGLSSAMVELRGIQRILDNRDALGF